MLSSSRRPARRWLSVTFALVAGFGVGAAPLAPARADTISVQTGQASTPGSNALGLAVTPLTPAIARNLGLDPTVRGVVVTATDLSSDAGAKLKRGDVIVSVDRSPVATAGDVARAVAQAQAARRSQVLLYVQRPKGAGEFIGVKLQ